VCNRNRLNLRTSDEIIARIEALAHLSGESKNSVANVLLSIQLGGTSGTTSEKSETSENHEESQDTSVVGDNSTDNSEKKSGATSESKTKRVSSSPTPPTPSQKKKVPKGTQKEKVSSLGNGRKPKSFEECLEYFKERRIPDPEPKAREFYDYYESKGWVVGKSPIKKWSCCITTWISNNPSWRPVWELTPKGFSLEEVLGWMEENHPEWYEKHKGAKNINDIDGFYIDEFRGH